MKKMKAATWAGKNFPGGRRMAPHVKGLKIGEPRLYIFVRRWVKQND